MHFDGTYVVYDPLKPSLRYLGKKPMRIFYSKSVNHLVEGVMVAVILINAGVEFVRERIAETAFHTIHELIARLLTVLHTATPRVVDRESVSRGCSIDERHSIVDRWRSACALVIALSLLSILPTWAQQAHEEKPPEKARQFLDLLSDPELKAWLEKKIPATSSVPELSITDSIATWEAAARDHVVALVSAIPRIPEELTDAAAVVSRDVNSGRPGLVVGILASLVAAGFGAEWLVRRALNRAQKGIVGLNTGPAVLSEAAALLSFTIASAGVLMAFEWPPLLQRIVLTLLLAIIAFRVVQSTANLPVFSSDGGASPDQPTPPSERDTANFWPRRVILISGVFLFGWAIISVMQTLGFSPEVSKLTAVSFGLGILAIAVDIVWRRAPSLLRRILLTLYLIVLWLTWVGGLLGLLWLGIFSLVLPTAVHEVGRLVGIWAAKAQRTGPLGVTLDVLIVRGARAAVLAAAVAWLAYIWRIRAASLAGSEAGAPIISGALNAIIILLVADLAWHVAKALITYRMDLAPNDGADSDELARNSRLRTLLPIFRNALAALIVTVTVLTILSGLGVQIAPLIAGAGIFGVAIGFGSQTLVKDVLSGVFYMLDDAFRVGEYIESGSYKGTVESFSLRSVRLRHHRGPVYTVPFGQLGAIQNMSRDWVIEKMTINVTYDSDVELARKLVKKIGQELAEDPEFAADTLQPLKMQGIDSFGDFAIVLRMKLMTKPATQFGIKRKAYMMIKKAFAENGIKIAVPTVHVEGGGGERAAAAGQILKMRQDAALIAAQAANEP